MARSILSTAVTGALARAPCSLRALARQAGVPHASLVLIRQGKRQATPELVGALTDALTDWMTACREAGRMLSDARKAHRRAQRKRGAR